MRYSVVLGEWLDRPISSDIEVAVAADAAGYGQVWVGEMAKLDAPVAATAIAERTSNIEPCLGPLAVTVRSPVQMALAVATVAATTGRRTHLALGTSSDVVARWHGRSRHGAAEALRRAVGEVQALFGGERVNGFRLREVPDGTTVTVAAFGPQAVAAAADADRMVLNMVTVASAGRLAGQHPNTAVWLAAAIDPSDAERRRLVSGYVPYLGAPGYAEMFTEAGFGDLVALAMTRPDIKELASHVPLQLLDAVALVGSTDEVRSRVADYEAAGIREIGLVISPLDTPSGRATLKALAADPFTLRRAPGVGQQSAVW